MKVLIACETSGIVKARFFALGHYTVSCDLLPAQAGAEWNHIEGDVREELHRGWDLMIAHPPCTYLSSSGMHWTTRGLRDPQLTEQALEFVRLLMDCPIPKIVIENPIGRISTAIRKPDQIIQPYEFGDDASKATCLWLKNLPKLTPTRYIEPRLVNSRKVQGVTYKRWSNQTDSGQNRLGPSEKRWQLRSQTYPGIADAMAQQWGT